MSTISLRLPNSLHKGVRELAKKEDVSINHLITTAVAEKLSALMTVEYLEACQAGETQEISARHGQSPECETPGRRRVVMRLEIFSPRHFHSASSAKSVDETNVECRCPAPSAPLRCIVNFDTSAGEPLKI